MSRKRGKFSTEEENFIKDHAATLDISQIAIQLNRTEEVIRDFLLRNKLTHKGMSEEVFDDTVLRARLSSRPYWKEIQNQFTDEELDYFAITWINMIKQFKDNILYTEEMQVKQWITLEIVSNRVMHDRANSIEQITRMQELLDTQYALQPPIRDDARIAALETEIAMLRNSLSSYTSEHTKILDKIKDIQRDLKMARADRIKKVEDSKESWAGLIKALEDSNIRNQVGEDFEIMALAQQQAKKDFSKIHVYGDGQIDQPILTTDTAQE